mmetsp:Transcript_35747/g.89148  ORF Transcript_35747/g.89148 Transcript_35747/m.89148 type:complete len:266 (-) Transcript_35747:244-1041(-)
MGAEEATAVVGRGPLFASVGRTVVAPAGLAEGGRASDLGCAGRGAARRVSPSTGAFLAGLGAGAGRGAAAGLGTAGAQSVATSPSISSSPSAAGAPLTSFSTSRPRISLDDLRLSCAKTTVTSRPSRGVWSRFFCASSASVASANSTKPKPRASLQPRVSTREESDSHRATVNERASDSRRVTSSERRPASGMCKRRSGQLKSDSQRAAAAAMAAGAAAAAAAAEEFEAGGRRARGQRGGGQAQVSRRPSLGSARAHPVGSTTSQ